MNPTINILELDNDMFTISPVNELRCQISYMSYNSNATQHIIPSSNTYPSQLSINLNSKIISLKRISFSINRNYTEDQINSYVKSIVKTELRSKFIPIILELGNKNIFNINSDTKKIDNFDIIIDKIEKKHSQEIGNKKNDKIRNDICSKINISSSYIAINGRIGPANFYLSNSKTHNFLNKYLYDGNKVKYEIDNSIKESCIIIGRKNTIDNNGVHCFIYSDNKKNIIFDKTETPYSTDYSFYYSIESIGSSSENQYLSLHTKSISQYRLEKIKKINESIYE